MTKDKPDAGSSEKEQSLPDISSESADQNQIQLLDQNLVSGDLDVAMKRAEKYLAIQDRVRKLAINLTNVNDWVNEGGNPYLQWTGTAKVAMAFGVSYENLTYKERTVQDDKGSYVTFECSGFVTWQGRKVPETGTGSSRDAFFGKKSGELIPTSEVDLNNIRKKALTNFLNRGLKSMIGLSFTWQEIIDATGGRIGPDVVQGVKYDKGSKGGTDKDTPEFHARKKRFGEMIFAICKGNKEQAGLYLEELTTWVDKKTNKTIKGKKSVKYLTAKQIDYHWSKIEEQYNAVKTDSKEPLKPEEKLPEIDQNTPTGGVKDIPPEERGYPSEIGDVDY